MLFGELEEPEILDVVEVGLLEVVYKTEDVRDAVVEAIAELVPALPEPVTPITVWA